METAAAVDEPNNRYYTRQATGLVREIGFSSTLFLNLSFMSIPYAILIATQAPESFPGSSLPWIVIFTIVLALPVAWMWGLLSQAMPRSGGDYVFNSRILHPVLGFAGSFNATTWYVLVIAELAALIPTFGISSALSTSGAVLHNATLISWATTITGKGWEFGLGALSLILVAGLMSVRLRLAMKIFGIIFIASLVGVAVAVILTAIHGRTDFQNDLAAQGVSYQHIISAAAKAGYAGYNGGINWVATLAATPLAFFALGYGIASPYAGGEIRGRNTMARSLIYAVLIAGVAMLVLMFLAERTFGANWLGSATYLAFNQPGAYPLAASPFYFYFVSLLTNNVVLIWVMGIGFVLASLVPMLPTFLMATRALFAWSFDRILPQKVSEVSERTHSPLVANAIVLLLALGFLALICFGPAQFYTMLFTAGAAEILTFIVLAFAAAIFPFRRRDLWTASPINKTVGKVPLITIVGALAFCVYVGLEIPLFTNSALGANAMVGIVATVVIALVPFVIYCVSFLVNRRNGIDLGLAFQTLPPE